jgi:cell pole-organizing protein PopZ
MPKPEQTPEPSIEEILASIRRIIADDAPASAVDAAALEEQPAPRAAAVQRGRPAELRPTRQSEDEVLELTEDFMLAPEAPSLTLQEPSEPEEYSGSQQYSDAHHSETQGEPQAYRDPYDESFARRPVRTAATESNAQDDAGGDSEGMFSAVMAEVQRYADSAPSHEPQERTPAPMENWGQPDIEALTPQPSSRGTSRPVWSARHKEVDTGRAPAEPAFARPEPATPWKPNLSGKDSWSQGVQMPVPDAGPAIPFPSEDALEPRFRMPPAPQPARQPVPEAAAKATQPEDKPAAPAARQAVPGFHDKAEELADRAVSDFTTDRLSAPAVVADILKGDKPLMDAITNSLANALSRETEEPDEFEEAPHPEDFAEDMFDSGKASSIPTPAPEPAVAAKPQRPAMPGITKLDGGFIAQQPVSAKVTQLPAADQEMPELPRDEVDDILAAADAQSTDRADYRPTRIAEPAMPNVPVAPSRGAMRPAAGAGTVLEQVPAERLHPTGGPKSLEDTIKEMLKPLLMQWLDENMPRIVNEALREEIAANGLLPPRAREVRR